MILLRLLRRGRCHHRLYPFGPRCQAPAGHDGLHYVWSGWAERQFFR